MAGIDWYVAYTNVQAEERAAEGLRRKGFATFLPMHLRLVKMGKRRGPLARPLFPRYVFAGVGPGGELDRWYDTPGVQDMIRNEGVPLKVRASLIDQLRELIDAGEFDQKEPARIAAGTHVQVMHGPFKGLAGVCQSVTGERRAKILIEFLKREVFLGLQIDQLSIIN